MKKRNTQNIYNFKAYKNVNFLHENNKKKSLQITNRTNKKCSYISAVLKEIKINQVIQGHLVISTCPHTFKFSWTFKILIKLNIYIYKERKNIKNTDGYN